MSDDHSSDARWLTVFDELAKYGCECMRDSQPMDDDAVKEILGNCSALELMDAQLRANVALELEQRMRVHCLEYCSHRGEEVIAIAKRLEDIWTREQRARF